MIKAGYCGVVIALSGLLFSTSSGAALSDDSEVCGKLAQEITKVSDRGQVPAGSILRVLADDGAGFVRFDREEAVTGGDELRTALRERFRFSAEDASNVVDDDGLQSTSLTVMKSAGLVALETEGGTAHCVDFQFFDVSGGGPARAVSGPEKTGGGYCWGSSAGEFATLGQIGGRPTFAVEEFGDGNERIRMFVRQHDGWAKSCKLAVSWKPDFAVKDADCEGATCPKLQQAAMEAVSQYDVARDTSSLWGKAPMQTTPEDRKQSFASYLGGNLGHEPFNNWPADPAPILAGAQYWTLGFGDGTITVVTVKARPKYDRQDVHRDFAITGDRASGVPQVVNMSVGNWQHSVDILTDLEGISDDTSYPYTSLSSDSVVVPIMAQGKTYLARIGHGWFGWRVSDDYLVNVLESDGAGFFNRAAVFLISKTRGREVSVRPFE
jgi:hypothetical protein